MKQLKLFPLLGLFVLLFASCGPTLQPFTRQMYEDNLWTEAELKRIQFYLSDDIVLRRELSGRLSEITSGEIKVVDGRKVEEIVIPRNTPGVFLFSPKENRFAVSFEGRGDDRFLMFGPNPKAGGRFVLLASDWNRRSGIVTYEGRKYRVDAGSAWAGLLVDLKRSRRVSVKSRTAGGREVQ